MAVSRSKKKTASKKPAASKPRAAVKTAAARRIPAAAKAARKSTNPLGLEKKPSGQFDTLQEIALEAWRKMPAPVWDHLMGGSDSEMTLRRNRAGLDALALRQRVLVDVRNIDMSTTLLSDSFVSGIRSSFSRSNSWRMYLLRLSISTGSRC
jgi:hypothetical protein